MKLSDNAMAVLKKRYLLTNEIGTQETPEEMFMRVAINIAQAEALYGGNVADKVYEFYNMMYDLKFIPNSPTLMNAGTDIQQLSACFVLPIEDSMSGIFKTLSDAALIFKRAGGLGLNFSSLRAKDTQVGSYGGISSGPISFMEVYDAMISSVKAGGRRRGAAMAVFNVDHPDIREFITCKKDKTKLNNFNVSIALTDKFMTAVNNNTTYDLIDHHGNIVRQENAKEIFDMIVANAWETGEPGILFIDEINRHNPTPHIGRIEAVNACAEIPALPYEACNLGSINLAQHIKFNENDEPTIDLCSLEDTVYSAVNFLDNVIDMNVYPLPEIDEVVKGNRKIGLGVMGFADLLFELGIPYGSEHSFDIAKWIMEYISNKAFKASEELAKGRGVYPNFNPLNEMEPKLRNATLTSIAPTGTISMIAGCSSGCEPAFALAYKRTIMDGTEMYEVNPVFKEVLEAEGLYSEELMEKVAKSGSIQHLEEIPIEIRKVFVTAHDITPEQHVRMQAAFQEYVDNAISKTVNLPHNATQEDVSNVYKLAYELKCKGVTIYRDGCRDNQVLSTGNTYKQEEVEIKPMSVEKKKRPHVLEGSTIKVTTGCGSLYVTINENADGEPIEVFGILGKSGRCVSSQTESLARTISLGLKSGVDIKDLAKQLKGISCNSPAWLSGGKQILSCADAFSYAINEYLKGKDGEETVHHINNIQMRTPEGEYITGKLEIKKTNEHAGACPDCGGSLTNESGCNVCKSCGYSKCGG